MSATFKDSGYSPAFRRVMKLFGRASVTSNQAVYVGVLPENADMPESHGTDLLEYAAINEFGQGHVPERSFLRSTFDENRETIRKMMVQDVNRIIDGTYTEDKMLRRVGGFLSKKVRSKVEAGGEPFILNAPSTVRKKGFNKPLIETGNLLSSIGYRIDKDVP